MSQLLSSATGSMAAANAVVGPVAMLNSNVTAIISGTFVGTVQLQVRQTGNSGAAWENLGSSVTAPGVVQISGLAGDLQYQLVMTAYTSGTASAYLAACPSS